MAAAAWAGRRRAGWARDAWASAEAAVEGRLLAGLDFAGNGRPEPSNKGFQAATETTGGYRRPGKHHRRDIRAQGRRFRVASPSKAGSPQPDCGPRFVNKVSAAKRPEWGKLDRHFSANFEVVGRLFAVRRALPVRKCPKTASGAVHRVQGAMGHFVNGRKRPLTARVCPAIDSLGSS